MASEAQVAAVLVRRLVDVLVERGIDRETLLREAGVPPEALGVLRLRLPWAMVEELIEAAESLTGDGRLGFHIARNHDLETVALPGILFFASRTLEDAMCRLARVQRLWSDAYRGAPLPGGEPGFSFELFRPERRANVHIREQALSDILVAIRHAVGARLAPVEARFSHAREGNLAEYEAFFGCPVRFGAGATELRLAPEHLQLPLATGNPLFARHFEQQAEEELAALPRGQAWAERVRALLEEDLDALRLGEATVESAAARLRASPRTFQRALGREGTTFARELEAVRRRSAERLLLAGVEIGEVSWRLGYAEPAVFHRAFKRWTGETPEGFRQSRRA